MKYAVSKILEIKLTRLSKFNNHICHRFYCDEQFNLYYKPKGRRVIIINKAKLHSMKNDYESSIPQIFKLIDMYDFVNKNK